MNAPRHARLPAAPTCVAHLLPLLLLALRYARFWASTLLQAGAMALVSLLLGAAAILMPLYPIFKLRQVRGPECPQRGEETPSPPRQAVGGWLWLWHTGSASGCAGC